MIIVQSNYKTEVRDGLESGNDDDLSLGYSRRNMRLKNVHTLVFYKFSYMKVGGGVENASGKEQVLLLLTQVNDAH